MPCLELHQHRRRTPLAPFVEYAILVANLLGNKYNSTTDDLKSFAAYFQNNETAAGVCRSVTATP